MIFFMIMIMLIRGGCFGGVGGETLAFYLLNDG
jgi:hypothetical protein